LNTPRIRKLLSQELKLNKEGYKLIAGVDEAGRGPLAGPVVASAVILYDTSFKCEINDSKKLSSINREKAYDEILGKAVVGVGIVDEKTIDDINIYWATIKAMQIAISNLKIPPDFVIVDGKVKFPSKCPVKAIVKGDSRSLSIAAASIIAKVTRDRIMLDYHDQYPQYNFKQHKGYPTRDHKKALKVHGPSPIHRRSYKPVKDLSPLSL
jgi:ribonuclease HII